MPGRPQERAAEHPISPISRFRTRGETYRVALKRISHGAALHAACARGDARRGAHHAAARLARRGAKFRRAARRLDRRAPSAPAGAHAVRRRRDGADPRRQSSHCRAAARARHGLDRTGARRQTKSLPLLCVSGERPHVARRVQDFLMREARRDIEAAVTRHAAKLGVTPRRITLRDTTSRWGSCSSTGALNFSWRLIMAPSYRARLSRRARGRPPRPHEPFAERSGKSSASSRRMSIAPRPGSRRMARACCASARIGPDHRRTKVK